MHCPYCSSDSSKVIDSRDSGDGIRRRRECIACGRRYTTMERAQTRTLMVVKQNDERREEFNRNKLLASLTKACAKRPLAMGIVAKAVDDIETALVESGKAEIPSEAIGRLVMERLMGLDRVAYIRYASVYRDFKDIETFKEAVDELLEPPEPKPEPSPQLSFLEDEPPLLPVRRRRGRPRRTQTSR